jgi:glycosyltransferase involved in cell wall biosynthesis
MNDRHGVTAAIGGSPLLSIVAPVYLSDAIVPEFVRRTCEGAARVTADFELLLVEDGSPDNSWSAIVSECDRDPRVKGVQLSRNFGQQPAITAGLAHARGRYVVVMDSDLQDDPEYIPDLYRKSLEGFDIVFARKRIRKFGVLRNLSTRFFYTMFRWLASIEYDQHVGAYSIVTRRVVDAFLQFGDYRRGYVIALGWLGFRRGYVNVEHRERPIGRSSYTTFALVSHAITLAVTYSDKPLRMSIYFGLVLSTLSFLLGIWLAARYFTSNVGQLALGWTSIIISHLFLSGLLLTSLGVVGLYIGGIFEQVKQRPIFVVRETRNVEG